MNEYLGLIYEVATGHIVKSIRMLQPFKVVDHYSLQAGQAFLIGQNVDDIDGFKVENDTLVAIEKPAPTIEQVQRGAKEDIDRVAGIMRGESITVAAGQAETYMAKEAEARAYVADSAPDPVNYPMLSAEIGITGADLTAVATVVIAKANEWKILAGAIESVRLGTKQLVDAATSTEEIEAINNSVVWP